jgi:hypothetical protein
MRHGKSAAITPITSWSIAMDGENPVSVLHVAPETRVEVTHTVAASSEIGGYAETDKNEFWKYKKAPKWSRINVF